jgi:hypothetical protein
VARVLQEFFGALKTGPSSLLSGQALYVSFSHYNSACCCLYIVSCRAQLVDTELNPLQECALPVMPQPISQLQCLHAKMCTLCLQARCWLTRS